MVGKRIEITEVDKYTVEKDDSFPEAYAFYIKLSDKPDPLWKRYFEDEMQHAIGLTREIRVGEDKLRLVFGHGENLQTHVNYTRQLVERTNKRVEKHYQRAEQEEEREQAKQEEIEKKKEEIRKKLREL